MRLCLECYVDCTQEHLLSLLTAASSPLMFLKELLELKLWCLEAQDSMQ